MKVTAIMATCGRHSLSERSLSLFLNQSYLNRELLIFQNSAIKQTLSDKVDPNLVKLVNCSIDKVTGHPYTNLGAIYRDAIDFVSQDSEVIIFWDDDDLFMQDHIEKGVEGLRTSKMKAYKPQSSYYRDTEAIVLAQNNMEPSIFVKKSHIQKYGFNLTTIDQHLQWLNPLLQSKEIFVDEQGKPTLIYNWGDDIFTFKTSGDSENPYNFANYRRYSNDHGDQIISPIDVNHIYQLLPKYD